MKGSENMGYSEKLKFYRKNQKKTLKEVADAIDISVSALTMYERGERIPRDETKIKLAKYYGQTVGSIFFNELDHET